MAKDISRKVVLVMLVIAIVLSVTGTWLVLDNLDKSTTRGYMVDSASSGKVELGIVGAGTQPAPSIGTGNIKLVIE